MFIYGIRWFRVGVCVCLLDPSKSILTDVLSNFRCCLCSCLPYCMSSFMSVHHFCPKCKSYIGTWKGWADRDTRILIYRYAVFYVIGYSVTLWGVDDIPCLSRITLRERAIRRDCHRSYHKITIYVTLILYKIRYECILLCVIDSTIVDSMLIYIWGNVIERVRVEFTDSVR